MLKNRLTTENIDAIKCEKRVSSQKHASLITKIQVYMFFSSNKRCAQKSSLIELKQ